MAIITYLVTVLMKRTTSLSRVDIASINLMDFPMTQRGKAALAQVRIATQQHVLQALAG